MATLAGAAAAAEAAGAVLAGRPSSLRSGRTSSIPAASPTQGAPRTAARPAAPGGASCRPSAPRTRRRASRRTSRWPRRRPSRSSGPWSRVCSTTTTPWTGRRGRCVRTSTAAHARRRHPAEERWRSPRTASTRTSQGTRPPTTSPCWCTPGHPGSPGLAGRRRRRARRLVTVLDVSGSMVGTKLALLKLAMGFVIDNLGSRDRLCVVSFSSGACLLMRLARMSDAGKALARRAVESLKAGGGTNIGEALRRAAKVIDERMHRNAVASVVLLSDGQDTYTVPRRGGYGGRDANYDALVPPSDPVHTFGFGTDHDAAAMHTIAEATGGTFSFIEDEAAIQDAFAQCIGGLLSVAVQELRVDIACVHPGVRVPRDQVRQLREPHRGRRPRRLRRRWRALRERGEAPPAVPARAEGPHRGRRHAPGQSGLRIPRHGHRTGQERRRRERGGAEALGRRDRGALRRGRARTRPGRGDGRHRGGAGGGGAWRARGGGGDPPQPAALRGAVRRGAGGGLHVPGAVARAAGDARARGGPAAVRAVRARVRARRAELARAAACHVAADGVRRRRGGDAGRRLDGGGAQRGLGYGGSHDVVHDAGDAGHAGPVAEVAGAAASPPTTDAKSGEEHFERTEQVSKQSFCECDVMPSDC
ncbi:uncharacterized protein C2845_PM01G40520 [Panicum miliaceum]|uniref:VWFA domain-containing protein n=1 Tax=Panicum miliaceum TaxID=4540 RepID=A0A3L6TRK1_PANMI|nr:uncharacterized protein C2845_PM01G40520 [Panicum miliaceum]